MPQQKPSPPLLIADSDVVLVAAPQKEFRQLRVSYKNWSDPLIFKEGETLELSWTTQGVVARRSGEPEAIDVTHAMAEAGALVVEQFSEVVTPQTLARHVYEAMRAVALNPPSP